MLSSLKVDDSAVSASGSYTFTNVDRNHTIEATFVVDNAAPTKPTVTFLSKTTNSFKVTAKSTDTDGDSLIYKLYVGGSLKATSFTVSSGTQVTLEATGLSNYSSYSYYVSVTDGKATVNSGNYSLTTNCGGPNSARCWSGSDFPCDDVTRSIDCKGYGTSSYGGDWNDDCGAYSWEGTSTSNTVSGKNYVCDGDNCHHNQGEPHGMWMEADIWCTGFGYEMEGYMCYYCGSVYCGGGYGPSGAEHYCNYCGGDGEAYYCSKHDTLDESHCAHGYTSAHE